MTTPVIGIPCRNALHPTRGVPMEGCLPSYLRRVAYAGGACVLIPRTADARSAEEVFNRIDGLLLPGGVEDIHPALYGQTPLDDMVFRPDEAQDALEICLIRLAVDRNRPLLAICRGIQVLGVALGGTLYQDIGRQRPASLPHHIIDRDGREAVHRVAVGAGTTLAAVAGVLEFGVNSRHHQAVRDVGPRTRVSAVAEDGVIEAVEVEGHRFAIGVQWHPELMETEESNRLFSAFVAAASRREES